MLTKIVDLGFAAPETGEPRVRLMQPGLVKIASTEIQRFWDAMPQDSKSSFLWVMAKIHYCKNEDGLSLPWKGRVWLNPPYGRETFRWLARLSEHKSGIALIFASDHTPKNYAIEKLRIPA